MHYDRRDTVRIFRERLQGMLDKGKTSQSAFARRIGIDRSTLSQLLSPQNDRLPRADTVAAMALAGQVSVDWLLGLSQDATSDAAIVGQPLEIAKDAWDPANERLTAWHAEAAGYKIRYIPSTLPDLLKTKEVNTFEHRSSKGMSPDLATTSAQSRLDYSRRPETDIEICSSFQALEGFARGEGIWRDLAVAMRRTQLQHIAELSDELYPTVRWFLYDALERYAPPITIFGPLRAVLYTGEVYFIFNSTEHIRLLTEHFDSLIRSAVVQPHELPQYTRDLMEGIDD